jgi:hypothetical protein
MQIAARPHLQGVVMNKKIVAVISAVSLIAGVAIGAEVRDWHEIKAADRHIDEALKEMNYDMGGHAAKAEEMLHNAKREIHEAIESARDR